MITALAITCATVWTLVAITSGIALGRGIHTADQHEAPTPQSPARP